MRKTMYKIMPAILSSILVLNGCSYSVEVNEKAYVIAMGVDEGKNDMLKVSFLFAYPTSGSTEESGGGEKNKKEKDIVTLEAPSIYSAMRMLNTFRSKQIDINHTKLVAFSEKLARKDGINNLIADLVNTRGFRPSIYMCVSQTEPEKLFKGMEPKQDVYIEKYIERLFSKMANNDVSESYLYNYYFNSVSRKSGGILPLVGLSDEKGAEEETEDYPYKKIDDFALNYTADEIPLDGESIATLCGYAVFDGKKMVGTLGMMESDIVNMIEKNMPYEQFSVLVPEKDKYAGISLRQTSSPIINIKTGAVPEISIDVKLWGEFTGVDGIFQTEEDYNRFSDYLDAAFTQKANDLIYRTQNEFGSDILGLGERAKRNFLTNEEWEAYNWNERYKTAKVNVNITVDINDFGELKFAPRHGE